MGLLDTGRVCVKTAGREAGRYCVIIKKMDDNFVLVTGPKVATKVKRRRCNLEHLEPLEDKVEIKAEASDEEVLKAYQKAGLFEKLKIEKPSAEKIAEAGRAARGKRPKEYKKAKAEKEAKAVKGEDKKAEKKGRPEKVKEKPAKKPGKEAEKGKKGKAKTKTEKKADKKK